jgi:hypothetical protein
MGGNMDGNGSGWGDNRYDGGGWGNGSNRYNGYNGW